ncbi:ferredoxin [Streptomyces sp. NPDC059255]|uniref:ferredoxin n=1 Tax=Streptomyces sp. NPDC059255 TaxID=3346793 RepID=UPI0036747A82
MIGIRVDRERCQGYGNCVMALAGAFDIDDEGLVVLKRATVGDGETGALRRAAYDCPTEAISFHAADDAGPEAEAGAETETGSGSGDRV